MQQCQCTELMMFDLIPLAGYKHIWLDWNKHLAFDTWYKPVCTVQRFSITVKSSLSSLVLTVSCGCEFWWSQQSAELGINFIQCRPLNAAAGTDYRAHQHILYHSVKLFSQWVTEYIPLQTSQLLKHRFECIHDMLLLDCLFA